MKDRLSHGRTRSFGELVERLNPPAEAVREVEDRIRAERERKQADAAGGTPGREGRHGDRLSARGVRVCRFRRDGRGHGRPDYLEER